MSEIPEEAVREANQPMQGHTDLDTCEKYPTEPCHYSYQMGQHLPPVGVCTCCGRADRRDVARQIAEAVAEATAALPHLRVQETAGEVVDRVVEVLHRERHYFVACDETTSCAQWREAARDAEELRAEGLPPAPRPVVDREALQAAIAGATGHISELDQHEEGEWEEGCTACAGWGYPCATLSAAVNAVLALLPDQDAIERDRAHIVVVTAKAIQQGQAADREQSALLPTEEDIKGEGS